jgi:hypothetical protein
MHFDGKHWRRMPSTRSAQLRLVWGTGPQNVLAFGPGTVIHFDGRRWSEREPPPSAEIRGAWGRNAADFYVVDEFGLVFHFDGSRFREHSRLSRRGFITAASGTASGAYVVGMAPHTHRFDGTRWTTMPLDAVIHLRDVMATSSGTGFAVGDDGALLRFVEPGSKARAGAATGAPHVR